MQANRTHPLDGPLELPGELGTPKRTYKNRLRRRDPCAYCGRRVSRKHCTIDHIDAKASGGSRESLTNLTGACATCNAEKGTLKLWEYLLLRLERLEAERVPNGYPNVLDGSDSPADLAARQASPVR